MQLLRSDDLSTLYVPVGACVVYVVVNIFLASLQGKDGAPLLPAAAVRTISIAHNIVMTLFSAYIMVNTVKHMVTQATYEQIYHESCSNLMSDSSPLPHLAYVFYLSKIYEFLDTWLVLWFTARYHGDFCCVGLFC